MRGDEVRGDEDLKSVELKRNVRVTATPSSGSVPMRAAFKNQRWQKFVKLLFFFPAKMVKFYVNNELKFSL